MESSKKSKNVNKHSNKDASTESNSSKIKKREREGEGHGASGITRKHAKAPPSDIREEVISPHSTEGCLSQLRLTQAYRIERRATGKRTLGSENQRRIPPNKRANIQPEANDDTRALANASRRSQAEEAESKHRASSMFENVVRISRGRKHIKGSPDKGVGGTVEDKTLSLEHAKVDVPDDSREANERFISKPQKGFVDTEPSGDESEALRALAELSASLTPADLMALESSAEWKEQRVVANTRETVLTSYNREKKTQNKQDLKIVSNMFTSAADNRKPKSA